MADHLTLFVDHEELVLSLNGVWLSNGEEVTHEETVRAFHRHLGKDEDGWFIRIGRDFKRVRVEDTAYFVTRIEGAPAQGYRVFLSNGATEPLNAQTLNYRPGRLVCRLRSGDEAKFLSVPYVELLKHLEEDQNSY